MDCPAQPTRGSTRPGLAGDRAPSGWARWSRRSPSGMSGSFTAVRRAGRPDERRSASKSGSAPVGGQAEHRGVRNAVPAVRHGTTSSRTSSPFRTVCADCSRRFDLRADRPMVLGQHRSRHRSPTAAASSADRVRRPGRRSSARLRPPTPTSTTSRSNRRKPSSSAAPCTTACVRRARAPVAIPSSLAWSTGLVVCCREEQSRRHTAGGGDRREVAELREHGLAGTPAEVLEKLRTLRGGRRRPVYLQMLDSPIWITCG